MSYTLRELETILLKFLLFFMFYPTGGIMFIQLL